MADTSPQQTIQELKELVVAYFRQEAVDPLKQLGRYLGFGIAGGLMLAIAVFAGAMALLRALQTETGDTFANNWSWAPYAIVVVALVAVSALFWRARTKRSDAT
ncbi:MAG TPA: hypothetical protein VFZ83_01160 [Acidimicrobiia bacterium]|nr:hypothetical protein [Acidimicrobiia bacterium]